MGLVGSVYTATSGLRAKRASPNLYTSCVYTAATQWDVCRYFTTMGVGSSECCLPEERRLWVQFPSNRRNTCLEVECSFCVYAGSLQD